MYPGLFLRGLHAKAWRSQSREIVCINNLLVTIERGIINNGVRIMNKSEPKVSKYVDFYYLCKIIWQI